MKVIVIGGAGYLGSVLVRQLLARGHRLRVIDNLTYGAEALNSVRADVDLLIRDVCDLSRRDLQDAEVVINCAGLSNDPTADWDPERNWRENFTAVMHSATAAALAGVRQFLFASSCSTYDGVTTESGPLTEDTRLAPKGHYSQAKLASERGLADLAIGDMGVTAFRMGTLYGLSSRMRFDLVLNRMVRAALLNGRVQVAGDGSLWRPLLGVRDAARAYVLAAEGRRPAGCQVVNLVGQNLRVRDVADAVVRAGQAEALDYPVSIGHSPLPARVRSYRADGQRAREMFGFAPRETVDRAARSMFHVLRTWSTAELDDPRHENIRWLTRDVAPV